MIKNEPKKLRFSYSIANAFMRSPEEAIAMYKHEYAPRTPEQERGIQFHKKLELEIKAKNKVSIGKTHLEFEKPECEKKVYVPYNEFVTLSAVFDCVDGDTLYDWKTGATSAYEYATGLQIPFYFFVLEKMGQHMKRGYIVHWDFDKEVSSLVSIPNSKKKLEQGENLVQTLSQEIYDYFNKHNIL